MTESEARENIGNEPTVKIALEPWNKRCVIGKEFPWASCAPFVENSRGTLIHRPRMGITYNLHKTGPHIAILFFCGMRVSSSGKNLTFLSSPPEGRIVCEKCEEKAIENWLPSADSLAGRHVHKGKTIAVATCCENRHV